MSFPVESSCLIGWLGSDAISFGKVFTVWSHENSHRELHSDILWESCLQSDYMSFPTESCLQSGLQSDYMSFPTESHRIWLTINNWHTQGLLFSHEAEIDINTFSMHLTVHLTHSRGCPGLWKVHWWGLVCGGSPSGQPRRFVHPRVFLKLRQ